MFLSPLFKPFQDLWKTLPPDDHNPRDVAYIVSIGFLIGLLVGAIIAIFRITTNKAYSFIVSWTGQNDTSPLAIGALFAVLIIAALITGFLVRNPAIRFGGEHWLRTSLAEGQKKPWLTILIPKFIGSWLVMASGISVGREGPCIQMGAATALGIKNFSSNDAIERHYFTLAGSAAGLAAAFSAPFSGICYINEVVGEKLNGTLLTFLLAGTLGVYFATNLIFDMGVMMPFGSTPMPDLNTIWIIVPLALISGCVGIAYSYLLRVSMLIYGRRKNFPPYLRPLAAFIGAGIMLLTFPGITGEGLTIFPAMEGGHAWVSVLCLFIVAKLLFTAFCYGSGIPAGMMVPILCLGGVTGGVYADLLQYLNLMDHTLAPSCIVMGMCGAFSASERAPLTGLILVLEMTGSYVTAPAMLVVGGIATFLARVSRVKKI